MKAAWEAGDNFWREWDALIQTLTARTESQVALAQLLQRRPFLPPIREGFIAGSRRRGKPTGAA